MTSSRYRWGGLAWLLTLQFFVVEAIAASRYGGYSYSADVISDLGTATSPAAALMNGSFVLQGLLIAAGALLLGPGLAGTGGRVAQVLLVAAGVGVLLVGVFPSDGNAGAHAVAAGVHLLGGGLGLIALAYGVRPRSEALGTTLAVLGLLGVIATVFFASVVFLFLGEGGMERVAAYVIPVGLTLAGVALWRQQDSWWELTNADGTPSRRQLREDARLERAQRQAERDAALEAAARRTEQRSTGLPSPGASSGTSTPGTSTPGTSTPGSSSGTDDEPDDFDPDDPWAAPRR